MSSELTDLRPCPRSAVHPPCPTWCVEHFDGADIGDPDFYRQHRSASHVTSYVPVGQDPRNAEEIVVWMEQCDYDGTPGTAQVKIGARGEPTSLVDGLHPDAPLTVRDAERFARALLAVVGCTGLKAGAALSEQAAGEINRFGRDVPMVVCVDCGHEFHSDSSPHADRCWECAERFDAEAGDPA